MFQSIIQFFSRSQQPKRQDRPIDERAEVKLGLALSSGGARGLAHVGALQVLEENNIEIHSIAGSSMGSYIGALWAAGFSGKDLENLAREMQDRRELWKLADPIFPPLKGLFHGIRAKKHLEKSIGDLRFEDLERELLIVTVDIDTKERVILRSGKISDAVHASCAMPGIIAPVTIQGRRCVDGGVVDPIPVGALRKYSSANRIIALSVIPTFEQIDAGVCTDDPKPHLSLTRRAITTINRNINFLADGNVVDTFRQSIRAAQIRIAHDSIRSADLILRPEHVPAAWHEYSNFEYFIESGRQVTLDHLDEIRELLKTGGKPNEKKPHDMVGECIA